jgi:hypothetical protein
MDLVLDSSIAVAWGLPDEASARADRLLARASGKYAFWGPALWWYEIGNALTWRVAGTDWWRPIEVA